MRTARAPLSERELDVYRRDRAAALARENRILRAERKRLERLLAHALLIAAAGRCDPLDLMHVLGEALGEDLSRPAWIEERDAIQQRRKEEAA